MGDGTYQRQHIGVGNADGVSLGHHPLLRSRPRRILPRLASCDVDGYGFALGGDRPGDVPRRHYGAGRGYAASGTATFTTSFAPVGSRSLRAYYGGDAVYLPSTSGWVTQTTASTTPGLRYVGSMAQLASGNYWKTTITLVNHGTAAARARLNFFNNNGGPLSLAITYPSLPPADPVLLSSVERSIEPGASFSFSTTGPDDVETVGWAQMLADGDISGFAVFRQNVHREQEAVVPLETHNSDSYVLWFNNSGDFITGLAVANNSPSAASIPVIVRDEAGNQIHTQTLELPALGHISGALTAIIGNTGGKVGSVEFRTPPGGQISVLGLRFNGISFTTIPVLDRLLTDRHRAVVIADSGWVGGATGFRTLLGDHHHAGQQRATPRPGRSWTSSITRAIRWFCRSPSRPRRGFRR